MGVSNLINRLQLNNYFPKTNKVRLVKLLQFLFPVK